MKILTIEELESIVGSHVWIYNEMTEKVEKKLVFSITLSENNKCTIRYWRANRCISEADLISIDLSSVSLSKKEALKKQAARLKDKADKLLQQSKMLENRANRFSFND